MAGAIAADQPIWFGAEKVEQLVDLRCRKSAHIIAVVDVSGRGADKDQAFEKLRLLNRGQHADHRAHRVANKNGILQVQLMDDFDQIVRIACEASILLRIVSRRIGAARANLIEQNRAKLAREGGSDVTPHILVAAIPVSENHGSWATALNSDVVSNLSRHLRP